MLTILKFHIDLSNILWIGYYYQPCLNQKIATWGELCKKEIINIHLSVEFLGARKWHKLPLDFTNLEFLGHVFSETLASILQSEYGSGAFLPWRTKLSKEMLRFLRWFFVCPRLAANENKTPYLNFCTAKTNCFTPPAISESKVSSLKANTLKLTHHLCRLVLSSW